MVCPFRWAGVVTGRLFEKMFRTAAQKQIPRAERLEPLDELLAQRAIDRLSELRRALQKEGTSGIRTRRPTSRRSSACRWRRCRWCRAACPRA